MIAHAWENRQSHVWENWHEPACGNMGGRATESSQLADSPFEFARMVLARSSVGGLEAALWRLKELQLRCGLAAGGLA